MTVEHLVGESQGGYLPQIRLAVAERFPTLEKLDQLRIAELIHDANTVTACHFCNSMTSRHRHGFNMVDLLALEGSPDEVVAVVVSQLAKVLGQKQSDIAVKNQAVREAFEAEILPAMQNRKP